MSFLRDNIVGAARQLRNVAKSFAPAQPAVTVDPATLVDPKEPKEWTVLTYMEGRDRLSHSVHVALNGQEQVGSTDSVNLVAQATMVPELGDRRFDGMGQVNTRRYYLTKDNDEDKVTSPVVEDLGEQKRLTPDSMEDFFAWGVKTFPAKHYMFVVKKHGLGFAKNGSSVAVSPRELREVLENLEKKTGVKPDVLSWDACTMMQMEVEYELKDRAQVMTGSPEAIRAVEFPYPTLLHNLTKYAKDETAEAVGQTVVQSYHVDAPLTTQTAVSLHKMGEVGHQVKHLVDTIFAADIPRDILYTDLMKSASYQPQESLSLDYNFRDVAGFLKNLGTDEKITDPRVKQAAVKAYKAVKDSELARNLHASKLATKHLSEGSGSSTFLPWKMPSHKLMESYSELAWAKDTGWDKLLAHILEQKTEPADPQQSSLSGRFSLGKMALYGYKKFVSPYLLSGCPYDPSCSQYTLEALKEHGLWKGSKMGFMRVISCQGHGAGGHDPVPHSHDRCPDHEHHHEMKPLPDVTLHVPEVAEKSALRKRTEIMAFRAARLAGSLLGGTVAALGAAPIGAALGAIWGGKAGAGTLDAFNDRVEEKYGHHKTESLKKIQSPLAEAGKLVHQKIEDWTGSKALAGAAGAVAGTVVGTTLGALGAAAFSFRYFGGFAGLGLQNVVKDYAGELPVHHHTEQLLRRDYAA